MLIDPPDTACFPEIEIHLKPGDICLHAVETVHRSNPNRTDRSRHQISIGARSSRARVDEKMRGRSAAIVSELHRENKRAGRDVT